MRRAALGDTGIVMIDIPDPLHLSASLFELGQYTIIATTEQQRFRHLLDRFFDLLLPKIEAVAQALPGLAVADHRTGIRRSALSAAFPFS